MLQSSRLMTNNSRSNVFSCSRSILLLPSLESRHTITETLESLASSRDLFDDIVISVNGLSSEDVRKAIEHAGLTCRRRIHLLCTRSVIPAIRHMQFICEYIRPIFAVESLVFLLADDDLVPSSFALSEYLDACGRRNSTTVGMGNLVSFVDRQGPVTDQVQHLLPGEYITSLEFLQRNKQGHLSTNMSSMVIPCSLFCESIDFMARWGSAGRRLEYIMATHHAVTALFSPSSPSALIRQHPQQEGRTLSLASMHHDELIYITWVWINQPSTRPWIDLRNKYGFTIVRFVRVAFSLLWLKLRDILRFEFS